MLVLLTALTLTATDECLQCAIPDLCPEGYACSDTFQGSSNYSACPAGFSCPVDFCADTAHGAYVSASSAYDCVRVVRA